MMWFDRKNFLDKCNGLLDDIEEGKLRTPTWAWLAVGAVTGLVLSSLRVRRKTEKPILAKFDKIEKEGRF